MSWAASLQRSEIRNDRCRLSEIRNDRCISERSEIKRRPHVRKFTIEIAFAVSLGIFAGKNLVDKNSGLGTPAFASILFPLRILKRERARARAKLGKTHSAAFKWLFCHYRFPQKMCSLWMSAGWEGWAAPDAHRFFYGSDPCGRLSQTVRRGYANGTEMRELSRKLFSHSHAIGSSSLP